MFLLRFLILFFSSRRRHTRYIGDWSSDVCSSDLTVATADTDYPAKALVGHQRRQSAGGNPASGGGSAGSNPAGGTKFDRSEESRVGKECRFQVLSER